MPIIEVQRKAGTFVGNGGTTTALDAATTADNTVAIFLAGSNVSTLTAPTGFTKHAPTNGVFILYLKRTAGGETTFTLNGPGSSISYNYLVVEFETPDTSFPVDVISPGVGNTNTNSLGTMPSSTTYDGLAVGMWGTVHTINPPTTFSGYTNGFEEQHDQTYSAGGYNTSLGVAWKPVQSLAIYGSTATQDTAGSSVNSMMVVLSAAGAKREPTVSHFWSFPAEMAGMTPLNTGPTGGRYFETVTGAPVILAGGWTATYRYREHSKCPPLCFEPPPGWDGPRSCGQHPLSNQQCVRGFGVGATC